MYLIFTKVSQSVLEATKRMRSLTAVPHCHAQSRICGNDDDGEQPPEGGGGLSFG